MRTILFAAAFLAATGGTAFAQQDDPRAALKRYCVGCHNSRLNTAGLDLDTLQGADVPANAATWEKVIRKLRGGTMPPQGSARPDAATYDALATWLETRIDEAARSRPRPGRRPRDSSIESHRVHATPFATCSPSRSMRRRSCHRTIPDSVSTTSPTSCRCPRC